MTTALDAEVIPQVVALLAEVGRLVVFDVRTKTPSSSAGAPTYGTEPDVSVRCSPPFPYESRFVDGEVILATDLQVVASPKDSTGAAWTPRLGIRATVDGATVMVVGVTPISAGDDAAAWQLQLRR